MSSCGQSCTILGIVCGIVASGSFGAPLKCHSVNMCNPDPFVLQTYKTAMCFITSWMLLFLGERCEVSPMGFVSGLLWVSGGVCGIFGIRNAGLARSVGTWSCVTVLISFMWGVAVFGEKVKSIPCTIFGLVILLGGFIGMTFYSSPNDLSNTSNEEELSTSNANALELDCDLTERLLEQAEAEENVSPSNENEVTREYENLHGEETIHLLGIPFSRRQMGILGAACDGLLGGSNLVPMHYSVDKGLNYVFSFAVGAAIVTLTGWILLFLKHSYHSKSFRSGYDLLPSMYFDKIGHLGVFSGVLWSIGNIGQIYTVSVLGESIGMSIVQSQMVVSGILGIAWFREIRGFQNVSGWIISALFTLGGIFILSHEHKI